MTIFAGKIATIPTWHLRLTLHPHFIIDSGYDKLFPATQLPALNFDPFQNINTEIFYDRELLTRHRFDQHSDLLLEKYLLDDMTLHDHRLEVILNGLDVNNNFKVSGQTVTVGIYIKIYIEGVDCDWYLYDQCSFKNPGSNDMIGQSFVSQNGKHTINLRTPIYQWLFDNENLIARQFAQKT